ncbi:MAG: hypothetical protein U9O41_09050 [Candidatus Aerophobetes bacterium]|nr:hypothetical protein [Candidatus Aerophobetes bacterium]
MIDNKKYVELLWTGKYGKYEKEGKLPFERPNLPFQTIETINEPRMKELAKKNGVDLKLVQIPSVNEIKSALVGFDLKLFKIPDQVVEKALLPYVKFAEVAYLEVKIEIKEKEVSLKITDFQLPPTAELAEIASKVKDSRELIDYWAIDWDYKGDTFHNQWQSFRVKKNPKVDYDAKHEYEEEGEYQIMVKVVDVFGNDTNKVLKVRIK